jgi:hypothetical protein
MPTITIDNVRISYPKLFVAKQIKGKGEFKYSAAFLIPVNHLKLMELYQIAEQVIAEAYPSGQIPHNFKALPCYDAALNPKYAALPDYAGVWVLNTSKRADQGAPEVVDQNMQAVIQPGKIYPGLVVNVGLSVYCYDVETSKGITTGLEAIQIVKDGPRLDNKPSADELFQPIAVSGGGPGGAAGGAAGGPGSAAGGKFNPLA